MKYLFLAVGFVATAFAASANEFKPAMQSYLGSSIYAWAHNPVLLDAIREQNARI